VLHNTYTQTKIINHIPKKLDKKPKKLVLSMYAIIKAGIDIILVIDNIFEAS